MRRLVLAFAFLALPSVLAAQGITVRDIIGLSKAGLGDEVLVALIDVNQPIFPVDVETLTSLKDAGVSPRVIIAMIQSGRTPPLPAVPLPQPLETPVVPVAPAVQPVQVVVVEHDRHDEPRVREVPVPVYVPVRVRSRGDYDDDGYHPRRPVGRPDPKPRQPVYWGWGGKLRPDAWKPSAADVQKDARVPREPQKQ